MQPVSPGIAYDTFDLFDSRAIIVLLIAASGFFATQPTHATERMNQTDQVSERHVKLETSMGTIELTLFSDKAPQTVDNFLLYVNAGFYDGLIFHRVIPNFMIQGGGFDEEMIPSPTRAPIRNEADNGLSNKRGTLAMARTGEVNSATAQFFINLSDNVFLDHGERDFGYAVFGEVTSGMEVVDAIASVPTGRNGQHADVPKEPVIIHRATLK